MPRKKRVDRLLRERETMGPVNLRAEQEATELDEQITTLQQERGDLIKAIEVAPAASRASRGIVSGFSPPSKRWTAISGRCSPACSAAAAPTWRCQIG